MPNANIFVELNFTAPLYIDYDSDGDIDIVGFNREIDDVTPNVFIEKGYEIAVLENKRQ